MDMDDHDNNIITTNNDITISGSSSLTSIYTRLLNGLSASPQKFPDNDFSSDDSAQYVSTSIFNPPPATSHDDTKDLKEYTLQLYEINDDPKRKEFLDDLFSFMQKRGTPINRLPIMAKSVLDLYELYNLVIARGGLVDVINKKLWQEIIKGLHLPSSITSAAFTLRTQYMKYLYPYECDKRRLSTPGELQAAIDGNRREGRRSSYGNYDTMQRSPNPVQMSSLSLVTQQQQQQLAACMNSVINSGISLHNGGVHHPSHPQPLGQPMNGGPLPGMAPSEFEARMREYVKLLNKEMRGAALDTQQQPMRPSIGDGDLSPISAVASSPLNPINLWNIYNSAAVHQTTPIEPQKEALNLSDPALPGMVVGKRERDTKESPVAMMAKKICKTECNDRDDDENGDNDDDESNKNDLPATHITMSINTRGESRNNGETPILFSMELNGVTYQGILSAQSAASRDRTAMTS